MSGLPYESSGSYTRRVDTITQYDFASDEIAGRFVGTCARMRRSIAEILAAALHELIEAKSI
jgi:hypothetical protein